MAFDPAQPEPGIVYLMAAVPDGQPLPERQAWAAVYAQSLAEGVVVLDGPVTQRRKVGRLWFTLYTWACRRPEPLTLPKRL